jgi:hypothetical protein
MRRTILTAVVWTICLTVVAAGSAAHGGGRTLSTECISPLDTIVDAGDAEVLPQGLDSPASLELLASGLFKYAGDFSPATSEELADSWTKHTFDTDGGDGPICIAGTPLTAFTRPGIPSKLLIFLQGGGACWQDFYFCNILADATPPPLSGPVSGIWLDSFDTGSETVNNPLAGWSILYVPYCDGSVFTGDNDVVDANFPFGPVRFHRGVRNLTAALDLAKAVFPHARRIVVAGSESGGHGASQFAPFLVRYLYGNRVKLSVFNDAGLFTPHNPDEASAIQARAADWQFTQFYPASCTECSAEGQPTALVGWRLDNDETVRDAYYCTDGDATNRFFNNIPTQEEYRELILTEHGVIHEAHPDRYNRFIRSGDDEHTALQLPTFYIGEADGVPLYEWMDDFLVPRPFWVDIVEDFVPIP